MIEFRIGMHDLDCLEELITEFHKRWGQDVSVVISKNFDVIHSAECVERRKTRQILRENISCCCTEKTVCPECHAHMHRRHAVTFPQFPTVVKCSKHDDNGAALTGKLKL